MTISAHGRFVMRRVQPLGKHGVWRGQGRLSVTDTGIRIQGKHLYSPRARWGLGLSLYVGLILAAVSVMSIVFPGPHGPPGAGILIVVLSYMIVNRWWLKREDLQIPFSAVAAFAVESPRHLSAIQFSGHPGCSPAVLETRDWEVVSRALEQHIPERPSRASEGRMRPQRTGTSEDALQLGFQTVGDLSSLAGRVQPLLEPLRHDQPEMAYSVSLGGQEAVFYVWKNEGASGWKGIFFRAGCAYVVLGPGAPRVRVWPKGVFGKPADSVDLSEDPGFCKLFWVEGTDAEAIRRFLGPQVRHFLLAWERGWRFHAGPEGVALVWGGGQRPAASGEQWKGEWPLPSHGAAQMRATLEWLERVAQAAGQR